MKELRKRRSKDVSSFNSEVCVNPWNGECGNTDVVLYIFYKGNRFPICRSCWNEISDKDFEWGEDYAY